jgi:hypothetical protein
MEMASILCAQCGGAVGPDDRFCPACGTGVGETAVVADQPGTATTPAAPPSFDERRLARFGQIARTIALLAFLLPWVTVSCAGQQVASVSGVRLATGVVTVRNPMSGALETHAGSANWAVLLAAAAIALALLVGFVRAGRRGALTSLALCGAAAALSIYAVLIDIPQQVGAAVQQRQAGGGSDFGASFADSVAHMIHIDAAIGFWIALLALIAAGGLDWLVQRRAPEPGSP